MTAIPEEPILNYAFSLYGIYLLSDPLDIGWLIMGSRHPFSHRLCLRRNSQSTKHTATGEVTDWLRIATVKKRGGIQKLTTIYSDDKISFVVPITPPPIDQETY